MFDIDGERKTGEGDGRRERERLKEIKREEIEMR